jgi:plasmid stabilization system protein ParE
MKIVYKKTFAQRLEKQLDYIAYHNSSAARKFQKELFEKIKDIPNNPLRFRKSIYFDNPSIRDLIYKGYTVVFKIKTDIIEVFGFVKHQEKPTE